MFRRNGRGVVTAALLATAALGLAGCGSGDTGEAAAPTGEAIKIGFMGDLTGPNKQLGINIINGAKLALQEYNDGDPAVPIELIEYDSQGDAKQATSLAPKVIDDGVVGLVGPAFSGETADTGPIWEEAGLPFVSPSATRTSLSENGWTTFHRMLATDDFQGAGVATLMKNAGFTSVAIIDDASTYGKPLADRVESVAKENNLQIPVREAVAAEGTTVPNYSSTVAAIKAADVDAVFYAGYYAQSGGFAKQLKDGGVDAQFISGDGSLDPAFVTGAGAAANGAVLTCPCALINDTAEGAQKEFFDAYTAAFDIDPGTYSPEGYDSMTAFIKAVEAGKVTREDILPFISDIEFEGVAKPVSFDEVGNIGGGTILTYQVKDGGIALIGTTDEAQLS